MSPADVGGLLAFADINAQVSSPLVNANNLHIHLILSNACCWCCQQAALLAERLCQAARAGCNRRMAHSVLQKHRSSTSTKIRHFAQNNTGKLVCLVDMVCL